MAAPWTSPLGIAAVLFLLAGGFHLLIGVMTPLAIRYFPNDPTLFVSERSDTKTFGESPQEKFAADPAWRIYRNFVLEILAGLLVALGLLEMMVAWVGVRNGQTWAVGILTATTLLLVLYWVLAFQPYVRAGAPLTLADLPPFIWFPTALELPAVVLAWIGMR
ncbi:MAG: hypothetical protein ACREDF_12010 [Thermoplasmata archaeon]